MLARKVLGCAIIAVVLAGIAFSLSEKRDATQKTSSLASHGRATPANSTVRVVHEHVVRQAAETGAPVSAGTALRAGTEESRPTSYEEVLFALDQRFEATAEDPPAQRRNERALRDILARTSPSAPLPIASLACRGPNCRAVLAFESAESARATLNFMPYDEEWKRLGFGFNAVPDDPDDPDSHHFVVYFSVGAPAAL